MTKTCKTCAQTLPIELFYTHPGTADRHLSTCIQCTRREAKKRYAEKRSDPKFVWDKRVNERNYLAIHKPLRPYYKRKPRTKKEKEQSYAQHQPFIKNLPKLPKGSHYHHWSYRHEDAIDVFVLTHIVHKRLHRYMVYDEEQLRYRRLDGMLLDTREAAQHYYDYVLSLQDGEYPSNPPS